MPSQLVCRPERGFPVAALRVAGTLDQVTGDALQQAVRLRLADQPTVLLLDVARLRIGDPVGLSALSSIACQAFEWPDVPVVLCGADSRTTAMLSDVPECAGLDFAGDFAGALAAARAETVPPRIRVRMRPVPDACRQVRRLVTQACETWNRAGLTSTATLIATELVANVVRHARTSMEVTLRPLNGERLGITVRDRSRRMPKPADAGLSDPGGRGLRLVRDLTDAWGVLPVTDGKVVWTRMRADAR
ncbi:ATP-binding protein [Paractinoplanes brasiliensis]|uniref:Histidine kinase-like protein n=1 Tax=Paractinoplanes brasiliensis TaxID=52695 RepID=A0A4R6J6V4_9ACTN|nr:ATP-binding protein [Actinoplanes brasiliensis]TDO31219.1 histidine kinase-like protein [Actinoplanes brasiliensis]GID28465.1 sulfate transporter [Actinoplanes brasiliensis]